jgi:hypothetical protein
VNWRSKRAVVLLIAVVCAIVFAGGMAVAWHDRHHTICPDGKPPVRQRPGFLNQVVYQCHDGRTVTLS